MEVCPGVDGRPIAVVAKAETEGRASATQSASANRHASRLRQSSDGRGAAAASRMRTSFFCSPGALRANSSRFGPRKKLFDSPIEFTLNAQGHHGGERRPMVA